MGGTEQKQKGRENLMDPDKCGDFRGAVEESKGTHGDGHATRCHTDDGPWMGGPETV